MKKSLAVWVISDGIAGHYRQSEGVVLALRALANVQETWLTITLKNGLYRQLLKWQINSGSFDLALLKRAYPDLVLPENRPDIIIGAGGKNLYAVAVLAQHFQAKSVFIGSLRGMKPAVFDLIFSIDAHLEPQYTKLDIAPMPIDNKTLLSAKTAWYQQNPKLPKDKPIYTMLIGGDGAGVTYQAADWQQLAQSMNQLAQAQNIRWLVTTSRRTPVIAEQILQQQLQPDALVQAVYWHENPQKIMQAYLAIGERIFITAESMTMLTEAIYANKPVSGCLPKASWQRLPKQNADHYRHLQRLRDKGYIRLCNMNLTAIDNSRVAIRTLPNCSLAIVTEHLATRLLDD